MLEKKVRLNRLLDAGLTVGLVLAFVTHETGVHPAIGIALAAGVVVHHALHWKWIVAMGKSLSRNLSARARLNLVLNAVSLLVFSLTIVTGLMMTQVSESPVANVESAFQPGEPRLALDTRTLGTAAVDSARPVDIRGRLNRDLTFETESRMRWRDANHAWLMLHVLGALLTLFTILLHLALHSKRIVHALGRTPAPPLSSKGAC